MCITLLTYSSLCFVQILLRYVISSGGKETAATALMAAFQKYHAQKYQLFIRITSLIVMVVSTILIALDVHRFQDDRYLLDAMLILRLVVVVPLCIGVIMWTFTRSYLDHTQLLVLPLGLLGAFIIVYAIVGKDPGYGSLAVYIVYLYGCGLVPDTAVCFPRYCVTSRLLVSSASASHRCGPAGARSCPASP